LFLSVGFKPAVVLKLLEFVWCIYGIQIYVIYTVAVDQKWLFLLRKWV
jgi:hypothetical protein